MRLTSAALDRSTTGSLDAVATDEASARRPPPCPSPRPPSPPLTRTGALVGTPAYMAPEQFLGSAIDARTDQFAFCVALYEALYGERPFAGESVIAIAESVTSGRISAPPKDARVPAWIRRILLRGLSVEPARRLSSMEALAAALAHDPAKRRRNWALAGGTLAVMLSLLGLSQRGARPATMCTGAGDRLAGIWEPGAGPSQRKTAIRNAFAGTGKSYAAQAYASASRLFDQYVERWTGMYTDACQATHVRGEQSAEVLDLRMACLNERLGNARALSDVFATADGKVVENAVSAAAALPSLDRCADVPGLRAVIKPPEDATTRKRVDELRVELAKLIALRDSGQCARAIPKADALIADVRAAAYQPLLAETLYESAQIGNNCGDAAEALQRFKDAHAAASASRNDEIAAKTAALIPPFAINRLAQVAVAREWLIVARGDVGRLHQETIADAILAQAEGMMAATDRAYGRALASADRSIEVTRRLLGPDDPLTVQWEANKGNWQAAAGQLAEALQTDIRVRDHFERLLGHDHPRLALIHSNEGEVLNLLGRHVEAEAAYQRAVDLFRQSGADPEYLAWALTGLGRAEIEQGRPLVALPALEEALAIRIERHASPSQLGETRFVLARALWSRPAQRRRALAMGVSARRSYGDDEKAVAEIDAWLTQARSSRS